MGYNKGIHHDGDIGKCFLPLFVYMRCHALTLILMWRVEDARSLLTLSTGTDKPFTHQIIIAIVIIVVIIVIWSNGSCTTFQPVHADCTYNPARLAVRKVTMTGKLNSTLDAQSWSALPRPVRANQVMGARSSRRNKSQGINRSCAPLVLVHHNSRPRSCVIYVLLINVELQEYSENSCGDE